MTGQPELPKGGHLLDLVEMLRLRHLNRSATTVELIATLEKAQLGLEEYWDSRPFSETSSCGHPGCNYRRYPISRFCMYHVTGKDTFAARLRRSINRDNARK
jgi:hypothetical protein